MLSILLDIEWLLSTLFDASLLTFEPPETAAPFFLLSRFGPCQDRSQARRQRHAAPLGGGFLRRPTSNILYRAAVECHKALILLVVPWGVLGVSRRCPGGLWSAARTTRSSFGTRAWPRSNYV